MPGLGALLSGLSLVASGPGAPVGVGTRLLQGRGSWHGAGTSQFEGVSTRSSQDGDPQHWHPWLTWGYLASEGPQPSPFPLLSRTPPRAHREPPRGHFGEHHMGQGVWAAAWEPGTAQCSSAQLSLAQLSSA